MHDVMPQLEIPDQGSLYDHEADADLQLGGRRNVADWGADDLFHHTPRRRRSATSLAARERRLSGPIGGEGSVHHLEEVNRQAAMRRFERESGQGRRPEPAHAGAIVTRIEDAPSYVADMPVEPVEAERALIEAAGRRTVEITGRPERLPLARPQRRRPPRTVEERIGSSPDRMAAWAVAMGMLLIFLAILTA
jgi:hypothetical protein